MSRRIGISRWPCSYRRKKRSVIVLNWNDGGGRACYPSNLLNSRLVLMVPLVVLGEEAAAVTDAVAEAHLVWDVEAHASHWVRRRRMVLPPLHVGVQTASTFLRHPLHLARERQRESDLRGRQSDH